MPLTREDICANDEQYRLALGVQDHPLILADPEMAEQAVAGCIAFRHLGLTYTEVGRQDIDWSAPQHKHQEWPAQLNRFFQLGPLRRAYVSTQEERYAETAADYLADWIRAHPTRDDWQLAAGDNTLTLSIRMLQWLESLPAFLASAAFPDAFKDEIVASAACQMDYLAAHLTAVGNWRIAQADSMFTASQRLRQHPHAAHWLDVSVRVLNDAFHRQVLPDGVHMERNPSYHGWMTAVFETYWRLAQALPEAGLTVHADKVAAMHDYGLASTRPNGACNALHDGHGVHSGARPEGWGEKRARFRRDAGLPDALPPFTQNFPHAGQACWRDSWDEDATYVTFDATTWGGGHCHLSRNSVQLHAHGRSLLVDPGSLTYEGSDPLMAACKSTRAHNTLSLNGWNQSEANPVFRLVGAPGYELATSLYHGGYWPGTYQWRFNNGRGHGLWAEHHRTLLWVKSRFLIVIDAFVHDGTDPAATVEKNWQFSEGEVEMDVEARTVRTLHPDANVLMLVPFVPEDTTMRLHVGETDPPRGWLRGMGGYAPATQLCLRTTTAASATLWLTVLVPYAGATPPAVKARASYDRCGALTLTWAQGATDQVFWTHRLETALDEVRGFTTDASLFHVASDAHGACQHGFAVDATYVRPQMPTARPAPDVFSF